MAPEKAVPLLLEAIRSLAEPRGVTQSQLAKYVSRTRQVTLQRAALVAQRALRQGVSSGFVERRRKRYRLAAYHEVFDVDSGDDAAGAGEGEDSGDDPPPEPAAIKDVVEARARRRRSRRRKRSRRRRSRRSRRGGSVRRRPWAPRRRHLLGDDE